MARQCKRVEVLATVTRHISAGNITFADHERLYHEILFDPEPALQECKRLGISLDDLRVYRRIQCTHPDIASQIAIRAAEIGLPLGPACLDSEQLGFDAE